MYQTLQIGTVGDHRWAAWWTWADIFVGERQDNDQGWSIVLADRTTCANLQALRSKLRLEH